MNPAVGTLSLYDVANVKGVAADISHVNTKAKTSVRGAARRTRVAAPATAAVGTREAGLAAGSACIAYVHSCSFAPAARVHAATLAANASPCVASP